MTGRDDTRAPEPLTVDEVADLAQRVRVEHSSDFKDHRSTTWECRCGWSTADRHAPVALFKQHVAEALARAVLDLIGDRYVPRTVHETEVESHAETAAIMRRVGDDRDRFRAAVLDLAQRSKTRGDYGRDDTDYLMGRSDGFRDAAAELLALTEQGSSEAS